jgi:geranylgeranyl diphosphate synthase type II
VKVETLPDYLAARREEVDRFLSSYLTPAECPPRPLHEAVRYSLFAGGKRLRPILCIAACEAVGGRAEVALPFAAALELIHTYSLVHDDLPAMDNDDLRRGRPTNHRVFGEGAAILAGDALLTSAFALMAEKGLASALPAKKILKVILELGVGAGSAGMVGGQMADLAAEKSSNLTLEDVFNIHARKTGALIVSAVRIGAILGGSGHANLAAMTRYGEAVGLAFQIADDLLDVEGSAATIGKGVGGDAAKAKWTYPRAIGIEAARQEADSLTHRAIRSLERFGAAADRLRELATYATRRDR